ncbi:hypothetical protein [Sphingomonas sp.]|uniref:hypothetical protein n=1 Tax=Sphingomonas sp. TaxID=28214 RepID=UPI002E0F5BF9|nr:hypothetical protein [Sphingomonas sp.]
MARRRMTLHRYHVGGWSVRSPRPLPYLAPDVGPERPDPIDITFGAFDPPAAPTRTVGPFTIHGPDLIDLHPPGGPRLRIRDGRAIIVADDDNLSAAEVHTFLFGPAFTILAHQRGRPPLHAGAVSLDGRTIGIAGNSGAGKSTMVHALVQRGARLLSDDQLLIDPATRLAYPAYPSAKLWAASAEQLAVPTDDDARVKHGFDKFHIDLGDTFLDAPQPLDLLLVLAPTPELTAPEARRFTRGEATAVLSRLTHYGEVASAAGRGGAMLQHAAAIAAQVPVYRVARPLDFAQFDALIDLVLSLDGEA